MLLRKAEKEIHELAVKISTIEKESNEQEVTYFLMDLTLDLALLHFCFLTLPFLRFDNNS